MSYWLPSRGVARYRKRIYSLVAFWLGCFSIVCLVKSSGQGNSSRGGGVRRVGANTFTRNLDYALASSSEPPFNVAVCSLVQNEAPYIAEWMAYHRMIGVDHFFIYDNNSTDNLEAAVAPFHARGWVTLVKPTYSTMDTKVWDFQKECSMRNELALSSRWLGTFDVDEFLILPGMVSSQLGGLLSILKRYEENLNCTGLVLDRYDFGPGLHLQPPKTGLVIENYIERSIDLGPYIQSIEHWPKLIGMPKYEVFDGVHWYDEEKSSGRSCLSDGRPPLRAERSKVFEPLRFHHYYTRSKSECIEKSERRKSDNKGRDWRAEGGESFCESVTQGGIGYDESKFVNDFTLADSEWPSLIRSFIKLLKKR